MAAMPNDPPEASPVPGVDNHVVIFRLAGEHYALGIHDVQEIVRLQAITSIPGVDPSIAGITNLRGHIVPVINLRTRLAAGPSADTGETRIVVVNSDSGVVGLLVDAVSEVLRIPADQVEPPGAVVDASGNPFVRAIARLDDRLVALLDLAAVLSVEGASRRDDRPLAAPEAA